MSDRQREADPLAWHRDRQWVGIEMERKMEGDFGEGYRYAMMKVFGRMFLTPEERVEGERVRREMFG